MQRACGCLGIDDRRCAAVAQVVPHDVTSAARERLAERVWQESIVVPPASKITDAAAAPKWSTPSVTPLASTVVMRPAPALWRRRVCEAQEPLDTSSTSRTAALLHRPSKRE